MNNQEKALARVLFQNKIFKSDGNTFEALFTEIMGYAELDFQQIKPWGNIGDRKNDGYIKNKGIYYQVFAPEDIRKSYTDTVSKLEEDFNGLLKNWSPVHEFYFLINDKYKGVNADAEQTINRLVSSHNLNSGKILTAKDLERIVFQLEDDQISSITSFLPDLNKITNLDFSIMNEIIGHIMHLPIAPLSGEIKFPDWDDKIAFNKLSRATKASLDFASQKLGVLDQYLSNQSFLAEELQKKLIGLYEEIKKNKDFPGEGLNGDFIFWEMVKKCSPKNEACYESAVITTLAKYFESCDIFEEPLKT